MRDLVMQIGNNTSESEASTQSRTALNAGEMRIWRRINWKQYSKENTEIRETVWVPEQFRDEDVSIKKEKKRVNVATIRKTKPIVASVPQYCSNRKIGILLTMDLTLHYKIMVTSR